MHHSGKVIGHESCWDKVGFDHKLLGGGLKQSGRTLASEFDHDQSKYARKPGNSPLNVRTFQAFKTV